MKVAIYARVSTHDRVELELIRERVVAGMDREERMNNGAQKTEALRLYRDGWKISDIAQILGETKWAARRLLRAADAEDPERGEYVDFADLPKLTGLNPSTLQKLKNRGELPVSRRNGRLVIPRRDVEPLQRRSKRRAILKGVNIR